jgi:hypothetical protein
VALIDDKRALINDRDIILMTIVEALNAGRYPASAGAVSVNIGGSKPSEVYEVLSRLARLDLLDERPGCFLLTLLGSELLLAELDWWQPAPREQERRERELTAAVQVRMS